MREDDKLHCNSMTTKVASGSVTLSSHFDCIAIFRARNNENDVSRHQARSQSSLGSDPTTVDAEMNRESVDSSDLPVFH